MRTVLLFALLLPAAPALAQTPADAPLPATPGPYVTVNVGIEMHALEVAAADTARATRELAVAVRELAVSPSLSEEHRAQLMTVIGRVDTLSSRVAGAVDRLPAAVRESREPLVAIAEDLASQVRWLIFGVVMLLLAMFLGMLAGAYLLIVRPGRLLAANAATGAHKLLHALERAAEILAGANAVLHAKQPAPPPAPETRTDAP